MQNPKFKIVINLFLISSLLLPSFSFAQTYTQPGTIDEVKAVGIKILEGLPGAIKTIWDEEAWPLWQKMWERMKPIIEPWWQKFLGLLGKEVEKRRPSLEQEFQKEKTEMQKDLWERFKELLD